jgi:hypothetical protein
MIDSTDDSIHFDSHTPNKPPDVVVAVAPTIDAVPSQHQHLLAPPAETTPLQPTGAHIALVRLADIRMDADTRVRCKLDTTAIEDYTNLLRNEMDFLCDRLPDARLPLPILYQDDNKVFWIADGWHRISALLRLTVEEWPCEIRQGTRWDAIAWGVSADHDQGVRKTERDKRRAVRLILQDPARAKWSNVKIAKTCHVSDVYVGKTRRELEAAGDVQKVTERVAQDGRVMNTGGIGARMPDSGASKTASSARAVGTTPNKSESNASEGTGAAATSFLNSSRVRACADLVAGVSPASTAPEPGHSPVTPPAEAPRAGALNADSLTPPTDASGLTLVLAKGDRSAISIERIASVRVAEIDGDTVRLVFEMVTAL